MEIVVSHPWIIDAFQNNPIEALGGVFVFAILVINALAKWMKL